MSGYWRGDRVRIVVEGVVRHVGPTCVQIADDASSDDVGWSTVATLESHVVSVEKVEPPKPPLPTTPGSVIRRTRDDGVTYYRLLRSDGRWIGESGMATAAEWLLEDYDTVHDAGAPS